MRLNVMPAYPFGSTFEGAPAKRMTDEQALRRSVMSCLLWESEFYEDGKTITARIEELSAKVSPAKLAEIAVEARHVQRLRHVPLLLLRALVKHGKGAMVADTIARVISRADELAEMVAIYRAGPGNKKMLPSQLKRGLAKAFGKFDEYQLAKYNRDGAFKLRDVLFLCHPKPRDDAQAALWKRLAENQLVTPDTWEVQLSGGSGKKATFERLIRENNLGYFALLRNLRNMVQAGCDLDLVRSAIIARKNGADKILPFRFVAAARATPMLEPEIDTALCEAIASGPAMSGQTVVLVDVSSSMHTKISGKSDMTRIDAAAALAAIVHGNIRLFTFSTRLVEVPPRRGMAGVDAIIRSQDHGGTNLADAVHYINVKVPHNRLIVITDEQASSTVPDPVCKLAYMINVASAKNGVGYGKWRHIDGWSDSVLRYIIEAEANDG